MPTLYHTPTLYTLLFKYMIKCIKHGKIRIICRITLDQYHPSALKALWMILVSRDDTDFAMYYSLYNTLLVVCILYYKKTIKYIWSNHSRSIHILSNFINNLLNNKRKLIGFVWFMVFNATFNNISIISWWSVLLMEETGAPGENHRHAGSHWQTLLHNVVSSTPRLSGVRTHNVTSDRHWLHRVVINPTTIRLRPWRLQPRR